MAKRRSRSRPTRPSKQSPRRVVVKFHDFVELRYEDRAEEQIRRLKLGPWDGLARRFRGITLRRMFNVIRPARIRSLVVEATNLDPSYRPPNFFTYFVVDVPTRVDPEQIATAFREWRVVQAAYVDPLDGPGVEPSGANPDFVANAQGYLEAAPNGIDARFVWTPPIVGGAGEWQKLIDMERAFVIGHQDLPPFTKLFGQYQVGFPQSPPSHGAGMLGVSCMRDNAFGGVGIAYRLAEVNVVSHWLGGADTNIDRPGAIMAAINYFSGERAFGRVLLIPIHIIDVVTDFNGKTWQYMPIETYLAEFDTIRLATALGIVVVEIAGNGGQVNNDALDNYREAGTGNYILKPAGPGFRDSGAIMIGSANSPLSPTDSAIPQPAVVRARRYTSNYGGRVNCFAWGDNVYTCSDPATAYTFKFSGTSSASAIVAGAVLSVQGMVENNLGWRLGAWQMRNLLTAGGLTSPTYGTPSANPLTDLIGVMPNLRAIAGALGLLPDLYLRDFVGDPGDPHAGAISMSPDIIVRPTAVSNPQMTFGTGAAVNDDMLGPTATFGQTNFVYARVLNRGAAAAGATVSVYYAAPASLLTPPWTKIGDAVIPNVPAGPGVTVSPAIPWATVPAPGHYCFIGVVGNALDQAPDPATLFDWTTYQQFIRQNNNITWRNFNVV